jgi:predicted hydrocarbon binding protein
MLSAFIKKLLFASEFMLDEGRVEMLGERQVMVPVTLLTRLQDISPEKAYKIGNEIMKHETDVVTKRIGNSKAEMLTAMKEFFETLGLGSLEVADIDMLKKRAIIRIHDSPIALSHAIFKKKDNCRITAGMLAGMFTSIFDAEATADEKFCVISGNAYCEFIIKTKIK